MSAFTVNADLKKEKRDRPDRQIPSRRQGSPGSLRSPTSSMRARSGTTPMRRVSWGLAGEYEPGHRVDEPLAEIHAQILDGTFEHSER